MCLQHVIFLGELGVVLLLVTFPTKLFAGDRLFILGVGHVRRKA